MNVDYELKKSDFNKVCRTCLSDKNKLSLLITEVTEKLSYFTSIQLNINDELPNMICVNCNELVNKSFHFKMLCETSNKILYDVLEKCNNVQENSDKITHKDSESTPVDESSSLMLSNCDGDSAHTSESVENNIRSSRRSPDDVSDDKNSDLKCKICNKIFIRSKAYSRHIKRHNLQKCYKCEQCFKEYKDLCELAKHMMNIHRVEPVTCKFCNRTFKIRLQLELHERTHVEKKSYDCKECGKVFKEVSKLKRHEKIHEAKKPSFACLFCDKTFTGEYTLKTHKRLYHDGQLKRHICNVCGKSVVDLKSHMRQKHATERPFECVSCPKSYASRPDLTRHERQAHEGRSPARTVLCATCGKKCTSRAALLRHATMHSDDRPFECTVCRKNYKSEASLKHHMRSHTGERPYACTLCEKRFYTSLVLKHHMHTHTGERPYVCGLCGRAYAHSGALYTHKKTH